MRGVINPERIILSDKVRYTISDTQKISDDYIGLDVDFQLIWENPNTCGIYCDGDETCVMCYRQVALINMDELKRDAKINNILK